MVKAMKALSLNIETLRELTPEDAAKVNGGRRHHKQHGGGKVSSVMPTGPVAKPTATAVSSAKPPTI